MNEPLCERTDEVLVAFQTEAWSDALRDHAGRCPACADALLVETLLGAESRAALAEAAARLPDATVVWHRALADDRRREVERATLPIAVVQAVAWACGAAGAAVAAWQALPVAGRWLGHLGELVDWRAPHLASHGEAGLAAAAGVVLFAVLFGVYSEWAEG